MHKNIDNVKRTQNSIVKLLIFLWLKLNNSKTKKNQLSQQNSFVDLIQTAAQNSLIIGIESEDYLNKTKTQGLPTDE